MFFYTYDFYFLYMQQSYICNIVTNIRLPIFTKYRFVIGVALCMLYSFVALPTRLWHTHECVTPAVIVNNDDQQQLITKAAAAYCDICSHAYAPYLFTDDVIACTGPVEFPVYSSPYLSYTRAVATILYDTRGSPVV